MSAEIQPKKIRLAEIWAVFFPSQPNFTKNRLRVYVNPTLHVISVVFLTSLPATLTLSPPEKFFSGYATDPIKSVLYTVVQKKTSPFNCRNNVVSCRSIFILIFGRYTEQQDYRSAIVAYTAKKLWGWCAKIAPTGILLGRSCTKPKTTVNKKLSYCWETVRRESMPRIAEVDVEMTT